MKKPPVLTDWGFFASPLRNNLTEQLYHPLTKQNEKEALTNLPISDKIIYHLGETNANAKWIN